MSNHFHLLCTPLKENGIADMNRSVGQSYVPYFNKKHRCTGKLWQGRYFSSPVENERYFLEVSRYIELNPVRAGIVTGPAEYPWSSYRGNALGKPSSLTTEHRVYLDLGKDKLSRLEAYRALFNDVLDAHFIKKQTKSGLPIGSSAFVEQLRD
jgi:putative transposase